MQKPDTEEPDHRLAVYGSLAPGESNHHHLVGIEGIWSAGWVEGVLHDRGWGAGMGFPGLVLEPGGPQVEVHLLESAELPKHWDRLDAFEDEQYRRRLAEVHAEGSDPILANIYVLRES